MERWLEEFIEKRKEYGISQSKLAVTVGISREAINKMERGKLNVSESTRKKLEAALLKLSPDAELTVIVDYLRIRFPNTDLKFVVNDILKLNIERMQHEGRGFSGYSERHILGDINLYSSSEQEKGILLELRGKGCRQLECFLVAQERSWFDFLHDCFSHEAKIKRLDLAINDSAGILNIPNLIEKCKDGEYASKFKSFRDYGSGELRNHKEQHKNEMGRTLYLGSLRSDIYFCIYEKDYEQYIKQGIELEEADVKNRFELRLKNDRAYYAIYDLLSNRDVDHTVFSIVNQYICFLERNEKNRKEEWKLSKDWAWFIGENRNKIKLTTQPEPYTLEKTLRWLSHQVMPMLKTVMEIDEKNETKNIESMVEHTELNERHRKIIEQQTTELKDLMCVGENI